VWFGRARREAEEQLEAYRREIQALNERCSRAEAAVEAAQAQLATASAERAAERDADRESAQKQIAALIGERDAARSAATVQVREITAAREAANSRVADLVAERDDLQNQLQLAQAAAGPSPAPAAGASSPAVAGATESPVDDATWALLLADLNRRWPVPVTVTVASGGSSPAGASTDAGAVPDQLAEAFVRELERLREEVGVDAEISVVDTFAPTRPVVFLLAALDLLGALTSTCQRVVVKLEDDLDMIGEDWEGRRDELDTARDRAIAAGAVVGPVEIDDNQVHLTLGPGLA
jgi:hypothetical protein